MDPDKAIRLVISVLAVWRLSHMIAFEDGPWRIIVKARTAAGSGMLGALMDCPYCLSVWFAIPFALYSARGTIIDAAVYWIGISGAATIIEKLLEKRNSK